MAKYLLSSALCASFFFLLPFVASANEVIDVFNVHIQLNPNGSAIVQEEIIYDFGENATNRHGIYRNIPLVYTIPGSTKEYTVEISSIMVTDGEGNLRQTTFRGGGNFIELKIGEPDILVSGRNRYVIKYTVFGAINQNLSGKDEFYWNVTGNGWKEYINSVRADVVLPLPMNENKITQACYFGPKGSTSRCTASTTPQEGTGIINSVRYTYDEVLSPHSGMSISVGIPKGIFLIQPHSNEKKLADSVGVYHWWRNPISSYLGMSILIPIFVFALMLRIWWKKGKEPEGRGVIIAEYDIPDHLSVLETAYIYRGSINGVALSASIIELAVMGYLKIEKKTKKIIFLNVPDFSLSFVPDLDLSRLSPPELLLYNGLKEHAKHNTVKLSVLQHKLASVSNVISREVVNILLSSGYYENNPRVTKTMYIGAGIAILALGILQPYANLALSISGIIVIIFGFLMPKMTVRGVITREHILGFKKYLEVVESDRINFTDSPEKNPELFQRFLPFAILFGVEKEWANKFENIFTQDNTSSWYKGDSGAVGAVALSQQILQFSDASSSVFSSAGGASGGGGSSGGGAGGGGGGSW